VSPSLALEGLFGALAAVAGLQVHGELMRLHVFKIAIAGDAGCVSPRCPSQTSTAPQEATGRLPDDVRKGF
jgi:hypothetical protein